MLFNNPFTSNRRHVRNSRALTLAFDRFRTSRRRAPTCRVYDHPRGRRRACMNAFRRRADVESYRPRRGGLRQSVRQLHPRAPRTDWDFLVEGRSRTPRRIQRPDHSSSTTSSRGTSHLRAPVCFQGARRGRGCPPAIRPPPPPSPSGRGRVAGACSKIMAVIGAPRRADDRARRCDGCRNDGRAPRFTPLRVPRPAA